MHRILSCLSLVGVLACGGSPGSTETAKPIADPVAPAATCPDMTVGKNSITFDVTEPKPDDDDDDDSEVPMWATGEPGRGAVECLPIGRYRLTLVDGAAKLSRRK